MPVPAREPLTYEITPSGPVPMLVAAARRPGTGYEQRSRDAPQAAAARGQGLPGRGVHPGDHRRDPVARDEPSARGGRSVSTRTPPCGPMLRMGAPRPCTGMKLT